MFRKNIGRRNKGRMSTKKLKQVKQDKRQRRNGPVTGKIIASDCSKNSYCDFETATLIKCRQIRKNPEMNLWIYKCDVCRYYHLTSLPPGKVVKNQ